MNKVLLLPLIMGIILGGCAASQQVATEIDNKNKMTLGIIQKDIKKGMSKTDVLMTLGSPNLVSNDDSGETWVYDKISTESQENSANISAGILGVGAILGVASGSASTNSSAVSQRTLTVVLKFDNHNILQKTSYHTSRF